MYIFILPGNETKLPDADMESWHAHPASSQERFDSVLKYFIGVMSKISEGTCHWWRNRACGDGWLHGAVPVSGTQCWILRQIMTQKIGGQPAEQSCFTTTFWYMQEQSFKCFRSTATNLVRAWTFPFASNTISCCSAQHLTQQEFAVALPEHASCCIIPQFV